MEPVLRGGSPADLVVLSADPLTVPLAELNGVGVVLMVNAGRVVWSPRAR